MDIITPQLLEQGIQRPLETIILLMGVVLVLVAFGGLLFVRMLSQQQARMLSLADRQQARALELAERQQRYLEDYSPRLDAISENLRNAGDLWKALAMNVAVLTDSIKLSSADTAARLSLLEGTFAEFAAHEKKALELLPVLRDKANNLQSSIDGLPGKVKQEIADTLKGILEELRVVRAQMEQSQRPCAGLEELQSEVRALMLRVESAISINGDHDDEEDTVEVKPIQENNA